MAVRHGSSKLTRKGQVTIPAGIRQALGLEEGHQLVFRLQDDEIRVIPALTIVRRTAGAVKTEGPPLTAEELREVAEEAIAADVMERMERSRR